MNLLFKLFSVLLFIFCSMLCKAADSHPSDNEGFISNWLICGPFPSYEVKGKDFGTGLDFDFLGGEAKVQPASGKKYKSVFLADESKMIVALDVTNEWGVRHTRDLVSEWKEMNFANPRKIVMDNVFPPIKDHFAFYAACYIESPQEQDIQIKLGSDDDHKLYLNGKQIGRSQTSQDARPRYIYKAKLKRGLNLLLFKVVDRLFNCGFCLALQKPDGTKLDNVKLYTDSPARKLGAECYDNGYAASFKLPEGTIYADAEKLKIGMRFFAPDQQTYTLKMGNKHTKLKNNQVWNLELPLRPGTIKLCCRVFDVNGREKAELSRSFQVYSRSKLKKECGFLLKEIQKIKREQALLKTEIAKNKSHLEKVKKELVLARKRAGDNYAKQRNAAAENAPSSIDEKLTAAPGLRSSLLLNGVWRAGKSSDKLTSSLRLPHNMFGGYFKSWHYPDDSYYDRKKGFRGSFIPLPGYEDFKFNDLLCSKQVSFEQDFKIDNLTSDYYFVCDNIIGSAEIYCNGTLCGKYSGTIGLVEIKMKNLKKGMNKLRIDYKVNPLIKGPEAHCYGIVGDLRLESRNPVYVADVWIKPSWRKASLQRITEINNTGKRTLPFVLRQYAVHNDRIKFRFPEQKGKLKPDCVTTIENDAKWRDPVLYSLENPYLYNLVSDLYIDGKLVDRKVDTFGFREFWIHGVDFFYNGKRILLQGDLGVGTFAVNKVRDVIFPLLRHDNINILRLHDSSCHTRPSVVDSADRYGMFIITQLYPQGDFSRKKNSSLVKEFGSAEKFMQSEYHKFNLQNYRRWHRLMRNHPSVLIWSIDNELMTPGCYSRGLEKRNRIVDGIADSYYGYMKSLDPGLVVTRDGDSCTYDSSHYKFRADTPANVHYPEYHKDWFVYDWQRKFEYRPALFGETLYCSYCWGGWPGAEPVRVRKKAERVRNTVKLYRELGIPAVIYMGLSLDGFVELKPDGSGSPWGVIELPKKDWKKRSENWHKGHPVNEYPFIRVNWPSDSGSDIHPEFQRNEINGFGYRGINWSSDKYPSHVRNAVNDAYRDSLIPQPPLADPQIAEVIIVVKPYADVYTTLSDGRRMGVRADANGRAWFKLKGKGIYEFEADGKKKKVDLSGTRKFASQPGFSHIKTISLNN